MPSVSAHAARSMSDEKTKKKQKKNAFFFQVTLHLRSITLSSCNTVNQPRLAEQPRCRGAFRAHLRALRSATITSADTPSSAAWHQAIQQPLRRAADGILRATDPTALIMPRIGQTAKIPVTLSRASSTLRLSTPFFSCCVDDVTARF